MLENTLIQTCLNDRASLNFLLFAYIMHCNFIIQTIHLLNYPFKIVFTKNQTKRRSLLIQLYQINRQFA